MAVGHNPWPPRFVGGTYCYTRIPCALWEQHCERVEALCDQLDTVLKGAEDLLGEWHEKHTDDFADLIRRAQRTLRDDEIITT